MKCYEYGEPGHQGRNCPSKQQSKKSCGFCNGPKRCMAKSWKAFNNKYGKCKLYRHYNQYCSKWTKARKL